MDLEDIKMLNKCRPQLVKDLLLEDVENELIAEELFEPFEFKKIKDKFKCEMERTQELLDLLHKKGTKAFDCFLRVLSLSPKRHLHELLLSCKNDEMKAKKYVLHRNDQKPKCQQENEEEMEINKFQEYLVQMKKEMHKKEKQNATEIKELKKRIKYLEMIHGIDCPNNQKYLEKSEMSHGYCRKIWEFFIKVVVLLLNGQFITLLDDYFIPWKTRNSFPGIYKATGTPFQEETEETNAKRLESRRHEWWRGEKSWCETFIAYYKLLKDYFSRTSS